MEGTIVDHHGKGAKTPWNGSGADLHRHVARRGGTFSSGGDALKKWYPILYYQFAANVILNDLVDFIVSIPQTSHIAAEILQTNMLRADLIYIDASHEYTDVLEDLERYGRLLSETGCMIGDGFAECRPGVVKAAIDYSQSVGLDLYVDDTKFFLTRDSTRIPEGCLSIKRQQQSAKVEKEGSVVARSSPIDTRLAPTTFGDLVHPQDARIIIFITFHYGNSRLRYLFEVIRTLAEFPVAFMTIVIVMNTSSETEIARIWNLGRHVIEHMKEMQVLSFPNLSNGLDLPWSHKPALRRAFEVESDAYSHFVYLEDDERFSCTNFCYFTRYSGALALHGLIPGFLRVEYNYAQDDLYSTDIVNQQTIGDRSSLVVGNCRFINSEHPYMGMFVMDRRHLTEYLGSQSFDKERSAKVSSWQTQERAAMGLLWEALPSGYTSRSVVPIDLLTRLTSPGCYVHHLPNNYTTNETNGVPFGKARINELFI